ncbi:hypothetical protein RM549_06140 [Salegentibacter sp. F188]|uniref:Lipoprotein n=1 Tax=Autumnicola patrickiae TaxID=3075591 RepID=A0ABU3E079_9FLAO|nr:hypothetical protein [Salegentibacter sp. F188]MDT0689357.1 hypothetical protein [Salegentibacter sp. F188]
MKKLLLLLSVLLILTGCEPDYEHNTGYEMEFVFFNPDVPGEIIISPDYQFKNGKIHQNESNGIYFVEWSQSEERFSLRFLANDRKIDFLWIEQWKYEHMEDAIPFEIIKPGREYRLEEDLSYMRAPQNGYYRLDVQRLKQ